MVHCISLQQIGPPQSSHHADTGAGLRTRSQAVARIADRTASQHLWGSRDVIGHVTIR